MTVSTKAKKQTVLGSSATATASGVEMAASSNGNPNAASPSATDGSGTGSEKKKKECGGHHGPCPELLAELEREPEPYIWLTVKNKKSESGGTP